MTVMYIHENGHPHFSLNRIISHVTVTAFKSINLQSGGVHQLTQLITRGVFFFEYCVFLELFILLNFVSCLLSQLYSYLFHK